MYVVMYLLTLIIIKKEVVLLQLSIKTRTKMNYFFYMKIGRSGKPNLNF